MATQAYQTWVAAGRPWRLAQPIAELQAWARGAGVAVLGTIGNEDHLTTSFPEDHTPFTFTAWPVPLPGYIVTAIDLANTNGLGPAIEAKARAGVYPWLKYMNHSGKHFSIFNNWRPVPNADQHVHLSIRTDWIDRSIGTFNPWGETMTGPLDDPKTFDYLNYRVEALARGRKAILAGPEKGVAVPLFVQTETMLAKLDALAARPPVQSAPVDPATLKAVLLDPEVLAAIAKANADENARRQQA